MTAPNARPLDSDRPPELAPLEGGTRVAGLAASPVRARQAMVETYAAERDNSHPQPKPHRRGAMRPAQLVSTRDLQEAAVAERLFRTADGIVAVVLALALAILAHPEGLLNAPIKDLLPLAAGVGFLAWSLRAARAYGFEHRESLVSTIARVAACLLASATAVAALIVLMGPSHADILAAQTWFALSALSLALAQAVWWRRITGWRSSGRLTPNIVIVGATENARKLIEQARDSGKLAVLGVFDDRLSRSPADV